MTRYIVLNDPHIDQKAPSFRRRDDYLQTCFDKLYQIAEFCREYDVDALLCTGDWFHKKNPIAVPHRVVVKLLEWTHYVTDELGIPIATLAGNHDVPDNDTSLPSLLRQPFGVLLQNPKVHLLDHNPLRLGNAVFYGTSFKKAIVNDDGSQVEDPAQFWFPIPDNRPDLWWIQLTHASVVPEPVMWHPHTPMTVALELSAADVMHTGHIHEELGIHEHTRSNGTRCWWTNTGSMTRGALTEETIAREPNVLLVELPNVTNRQDVPDVVAPKFKRLVLTHAPAASIYNVESYREEKVQRKEFSAYTERLRGELTDVPTETKEKSLTQLVEESSLDYPARQLAHRLLNAAGA